MYVGYGYFVALMVFTSLFALACCLLFPREWHVEYFICTFLFGHSNEFHSIPCCWALCGRGRLYAAA